MPHHQQPRKPTHAVHRRSLIHAVSGITAGTFFLPVGRSSSSWATAHASSSRSESSAAAAVLEDPNWPDKFPFGEEAFQRFDETPDEEFYSYPRFVTHIDDAAISSLTAFYEKTFPSSGADGVAILDVCSSWISHYPKGYTAGRISGLGMNREELERNPVLTDFVVRDLNEDPTFPYEEDTFDVITNCVSVDYLTKPLAVFSEMQRVLKPGRKHMLGLLQYDAFV